MKLNHGRSLEFFNGKTNSRNIQGWIWQIIEKIQAEARDFFSQKKTCTWFSKKSKRKMVSWYRVGSILRWSWKSAPFLSYFPAT